MVDEVGSFGSHNSGIFLSVPVAAKRKAETIPPIIYVVKSSDIIIK